MEYNVFDIDEIGPKVGIDNFADESRSKVVISLYNHDLKNLRDGEVIVTAGWIQDKNYGGEYRIILQGRRVGVGREENRLLGPDGRPVITIPN